MRLIISTPNWTLNGVNTFSASLVRGLQPQGVNATLLVTGSLWRDQKPLPWPNDLPIQQLPLPTIATWSARWQALKRYLIAQAPCIYLPNHDILHSAITPLLPPSIGVVGIAHSDDPQHYEHIRRLGPWCNAVVGVSASITQQLMAMPELRDIHTLHIPYGVSASDELEGAKDSVPAGDGIVPDQRFSILYAGRLDQHQKRVGDLALVLHALHQRGVKAQLTIAGEGPAKELLQQQLDTFNLAAYVRWLGIVAPSAMPQLYRTHPVLLLPSAYEGLPLVMIEAMSYGCVPVVSALASGIPELIEDGVNGYFIPVGDYEGFANRLCTIAKAPRQWQTMATAARATVLTSGYTLNTMAQRYNALFQEIWRDLLDGRYRRPVGTFQPPWELTWRQYLRAPLARWLHRSS